MKKLSFIILAFFLRHLPVQILATLITRRIKPIESKQSSLKIFVLDRARFREDITALNKFTDIEYYDFPILIQDKIAALFACKYGYEKHGENTQYHLAHAQYLHRLIPLICRKLSVSGFISCGMYYARHIDWEKSCTTSNTPYFCIHREGVGIAAEPLNRLFGDSMAGRRRFNGHHIMVGTDAFRDMLISSGYAKADDVTTTGLPRFDLNFVSDHPVNEQKQVLLFSFFLASGQLELVEKEGVFPDGKGFIRLFLDVHERFAKLALQYPEVNFVIKPKWYESTWKQLIDKSVANGCGISQTDSWPANLQVIDDVGAQTLIAQSGMVIAFNSTTMFEAMQYKKQVMMPLYEEASDSLSEFLYIPEPGDAMHVAYSGQEFDALIKQFIEGTLAKKVPTDAFINEAVGFIDGSVSSRIETIMRERIEQIQG